jgi:predicted transcriptional regulator of viral defense system
MWVRTFASEILKELAAAHRRVVADWRILILARRLAQAENAPLPDEKKAVAIRRDLVRRGDLTQVEGVSDVYVVDVPYANLLEVSEEQIVQEANPWAVFGFLTAMTHHGLTDLVPSEVYAITTKGRGHTERLPLGTMPDDWTDGLQLSLLKHPKKVGKVPINWTRLNEEAGFGVTIGYSFGIPIYVTDVERTLLDALRMPDKSGGIGKVLQAWKSADTLNMNKIIEYCDKYNNQILRQRVGFLLEKLGRAHPRLEEWRHQMQRGGSVRLVASNAYSDTYSVEWNLSLNVPPSVLAVLEKD